MSLTLILTLTCLNSSYFSSFCVFTFQNSFFHFIRFQFLFLTFLNVDRVHGKLIICQVYYACAEIFFAFKLFKRSYLDCLGHAFFSLFICCNFVRPGQKYFSFTNFWVTYNKFTKLCFIWPFTWAFLNLSELFESNSHNVQSQIK